MHEYFPKFLYNDADTKERIFLVGGKCEHSHHFHMASNWHSFKVSEVFKSFFNYRYLKYHHLNYEILQNDKIRNITLQNENSFPSQHSISISNTNRIARTSSAFEAFMATGCLFVYIFLFVSKYLCVQFEDSIFTFPLCTRN